MLPLGIKFYLSIKKTQRIPTVENSSLIFLLMFYVWSLKSNRALSCMSLILTNY